MVDRLIFGTAALIAAVVLAACDVVVVDRNSVGTNTSVPQDRQPRQTRQRREARGPAIIKPDLSVTWASDFGPIDFRGGHYGDTSKTITGRLFWSGSQWIYEGRWTVNARGDRLTFVFSPDGRHFSGTFVRPNAGTYAWNGRRQPGLRLAKVDSGDARATTTRRPETRATLSRCARSVQGRIAWDFRGNKIWDDANLHRLCEGASDSTEPGQCFARIRRFGVAGSALRLEVCRGARNSEARIACYRRWVSEGETLESAAARCRSSGDARLPDRPRGKLRTTAVFFDGGSFKSIGGGRWVETGRDGRVRFRFVEKRRTDRAIWLEDKSRGITVFIDPFRRTTTFRQAGSNALRPLYPVTRVVD